MGEDENLDMGLFDSSEDIELNLDFTPDYEEDNDSEEEQEDIIDTSEDQGEDPDLEEVTGDEDDEEEEDNSAEDDASNTTSPSMYSSFANLLHEEGLLSSLDSDKEIKSIADVKDLISSEIEKRVESQLSDEEIEDLKLIRSGVDKQELTQHRKLESQLNSISDDLIESNTELRKQLIYQDYVNQGLSQEKALKLLNRSIELEQDKEDAIEALQSIKSFEANKLEERKVQAQIEREQAEQEYKANQKKIKDSIFAKDEIIKGQKLTQTMKDRVYKSMTEIIGNSPQGNPENALMKARRENPIEFDSKLYYLFEITKGFEDFGILGKKAKSNAASELERALRSNSFIEESGLPSYLQDENSYDNGFGDELVLD